MRLYDINIETTKDEAILYAQLECGFSNINKIWFSVPIEYYDWLTYDVYDAFMVAALYPAMYYGEDIQIDGYVSPELYFNCHNYIPSIIQAYRPDMKNVAIAVRGFRNAEKKSYHIGTGFSAGIDSFVTLYDRYFTESMSEYKVDTLFLFNLGSHGGGGKRAEKKFLDRYNYLAPYPKSLGIPYIRLNSNLFDLYLYEWEFDAGIFCRATGALVFQRKLSRYYISSDNSYFEHMRFLFDLSRTDLSSIIEHSLHPLLSTDSLVLVTDGGQYRRTQKTERIAQWKPVQKYLNVCVNSYDSVQNCTMCHKCRRTCFALDVLGKLDEYKEIFDLDLWKKYRRRYKYELVYNYTRDIYAKDNVDFAREKGYPMPSFLLTHIYMFPMTIYTAVKSITKRVIGQRIYNKLWRVLHSKKS